MTRATEEDWGNLIMPDLLESDKGVHILGDILASWIIFKKTHDVKTLRFRCCENSRAFFDALDAYEMLMTNDGKDPLT